MPLSILLPMVVFGIGGIAVFLHILGLTQQAYIRTKDQARTAWLSEFPDDPPRDITLSETGRFALITTAHGKGLIWPMGADTTARYITGARMAQKGNTLTLRLPDYTAPKIKLRPGSAEAQHWHTLLQDLT